MIAECQLDVVFLLDRSGSICDAAGPGLPPSWNYLIDFAVELTETFDIGPNAVKVSTVTFGNKGKVYFYLEEFTTQSDVATYLREIDCKRENTNTTGGIWVTRNDVFGFSW